MNSLSHSYSLSSPLPLIHLQKLINTSLCVSVSVCLCEYVCAHYCACVCGRVPRPGRCPQRINKHKYRGESPESEPDPLAAPSLVQRQVKVFNCQNVCAGALHTQSHTQCQQGHNRCAHTRAAAPTPSAAAATAAALPPTAAAATGNC